MSKVAKEIDTEMARTIAARAMNFHRDAAESAAMAVARAIACGVQLLKARELLPYGDLMKWYRKYLRSISERTCQRYAALADKLCAAGMGGCIKKMDVAPEKLTPAYIRRFVPEIGKIIEGKMLTELFQEYGIIKQRKAHDQEAMDRQERVKSRNPRDQREEQLYFLQDWFKEVDDRLCKFADWADDYRVENPELIETATATLTAALEKLTLKKVALS